MPAVLFFPFIPHFFRHPRYSHLLESALHRTSIQRQSNDPCTLSLFLLQLLPPKGDFVGEFSGAKITHNLKPDISISRERRGEEKRLSVCQHEDCKLKGGIG